MKIYRVCQKKKNSFDIRYLQWSGTCLWKKFIICYFQVKSGDIEEEYKKSVRDFDRRQKMKTSRKNSFLTDIKYKSLESILGGQKVRNMLNSINFK